MAEEFKSENHRTGKSTSYHITGFRSLLDFSLALNPGLNVLVGPNGSGKTNFIEFLDFLDIAIRQSASTAVSSSGGVSKVFCQENSKKNQVSVQGKISGLADLADVARREESNPYRFFYYEYDIEIKFNRRESVIFISKEIIRFYKLHNENERCANSYLGIISLTRNSASDEAPPRWIVSPKLQADNKRNPLRVQPRYISSRQLKDSYINRFESTPIAPDESIFSIRTGFPATDAIRLAITKGRSFNILPSKVREPDDLTKPPGIMRDGSGLSSTLHYLQRLKRYPNTSQPARLRLAKPSTLDTVIELTRLVFPNLSNLSAPQDPHTGKFLGALTLGIDRPIKISLQSASDGTLKWLSLITLVISSGGIYSIEEPENFLHPRMQQFLIQLFRDSLESQRAGAYFILSTHSETLINQCRPEELVVFNFDERGTQAHRIANPERIMEEINRTGFGLGYYYANNSIS